MNISLQNSSILVFGFLLFFSFNVYISIALASCTTECVGGYVEEYNYLGAFLTDSGVEYHPGYDGDGRLVADCVDLYAGSPMQLCDVWEVNEVWDPCVSTEEMCMPECTYNISGSDSCANQGWGDTGTIYFTYTYCPGPPPTWDDYVESSNTCAWNPVPDVLGCTDSSALNYNPSANVDDGSCTFSEGVSCTSAPNACGETNVGVIDNGSCTAGTPDDPVGYGDPCVSAPNVCGETNTGTIQCDGSCSADTPLDFSCAPVTTGCDAAAIEGCTLNASEHGSRSGVCGGEGSCSYTCSGGSWVESDNTCSLISIPTLSTDKRDVRKDSQVTFEYNTAGYSCVLMAGLVNVFPDTTFVGSGTTAPVTVGAQTTYILDCDSVIDPAVTVRILPVGFES